MNRPALPHALLALACAAVASVFPLVAPARAEGGCDPSFLPRVDLGLLQASALTEASGLAAGRRNPGVFWTHNDSGDLNRVFALNGQGQHLGIYTIAGVTNRDWEDIAAGPGPETGRSYLYIGEIGDNDSVYGTKYIYRLPEPRVDPAQTPIDTTLSEVEAIAFQYPDGRRDAETLMVDPLTRDIYVVSKREAAVMVYRAPYPQQVGPVITLEHVATLPLTSVVAGDIASSGREILIKTYTQVFHWCRGEGQSVANALMAAPTSVPYTTEPQGEALGWDADGLGYYTTSEEPSGIQAHLYHYPRNPASSAQDGQVPAGDGGPDSGPGTWPCPPPAPNPFRGSTSIRYLLLRPTAVSLQVRTAAGRHVRRLTEARQEAGERAWLWNGCDDSGRPMPAGAYYYVLRTEYGMHRGRVMLVR